MLYIYMQNNTFFHIPFSFYLATNIISCVHDTFLHVRIYLYLYSRLVYIQPQIYFTTIVWCMWIYITTTKSSYTMYYYVNGVKNWELTTHTVQFATLSSITTKKNQSSYLISQEKRTTDWSKHFARDGDFYFKAKCEL